MPSAASLRTDTSTQRLRVPHASGRAVRGVVNPPARAPQEEFREPELELVQRAERRSADADELARARRVIAEREQLIRRLAERNFALQCSLAGALAQLREREAELQELRVGTALEADSEEHYSAKPGRSVQRVSLRVGERGSSEHSGVRRSDAEPELTVEFGADSHFFAGLMPDLAHGGLFVASYRRLPLGTRVEVTFELSDGSRQVVSGEVRWLREQRTSDCERPGMGVAFRELSEATLEALEELCREHPVLYVEL